MIMLNQPEELMEKAAAGDKEAFSLLYKEYFVPIFRYIYLRLRDTETAEDLAQNVFVKVFKKIKFYKNKNRPPLAYFFTVARNNLIDHWRRNKNAAPLELTDEALLVSGDHGREMDDRMGKERIKKILDCLPEDQKEAMILKYINELDNKEISFILKKKEDAVRQLHCRALKKIRQYFNSDKYELS
jgi:RNA polymerase sigma-70 factor (ECF subfamily)